MVVVPNFVDTNSDVVEALKVAFAPFEGISLYNEKIEDVVKEYSTFVTAGNSFGIMDGGIDLAVRDYVGIEIQDRVQAAIQDTYCGFMPIGAALSFELDDADKHLIYVPTMFYPMNVSGTLNAYLAMKAALVEADTLGASTVLIPGLCTLTGKMHPKIAATQMAQAYIHYLEPPVLPNWEATNAFWADFREKQF